MVVPDELAHAEPAPPAVREPFSPAWWQDQPSDELRAILHRGVQGGEAFFAAAAELERRAKEANAAVRAAEEHVIEDGHQLKKMAWIGLAGLAVAVILMGRLLGFWW